MHSHGLKFRSKLVLWDDGMYRNNAKFDLFDATKPNEYGFETLKQKIQNHFLESYSNKIQMNLKKVVHTMALIYSVNICGEKSQ